MERQEAPLLKIWNPIVGESHANALLEIFRSLPPSLTHDLEHSKRMQKHNIPFTLLNFVGLVRKVELKEQQV